MTRVQLSVEPTFQMRQDVSTASRGRRCSGRFDEITSASYSVSIFTRYEPDAVDQVWIKSRDGRRPGRAVRRSSWRARDQHPILGLDPVERDRAARRAGPWYDRLPHFRMGFTPSNGTEIQSEYLVPRERAVAAIEAVRGISEQVRPLLQVTEIRTIAADDLWLSSAYERDAVGIHFTARDDPDGCARCCRSSRRRSSPSTPGRTGASGSPMGREGIEARYPRLADFRDLVARTDPTASSATTSSTGSCCSRRSAACAIRGG